MALNLSKGSFDRYPGWVNSGIPKLRMVQYMIIVCLNPFSFREENIIGEAALKEPQTFERAACLTHAVSWSHV